MQPSLNDITGTIFNIQEFSVQDGPGVRTTVFFQGCNLRCKWCHNPESWDIFPCLVFRPERCIGCGKCVTACPNGAITVADGVLDVDRGVCKNCGVCAKTCYAGALSMSGEEMTAAKVAERLIASKPYFVNGGGGVTFSGGDGMLQIDFLSTLLRVCKENGIHTAVDTAGNVPYAYFERVKPYTDLFLYDLKAATPALHSELTGTDPALIWGNLERLLADGAKIYVRIPCVPGANWYDIPNIAKKLQNCAVEAVELCPYHRLGEGKFAFLGLEPSLYEVPSNADMERLLPMFERAGRLVTYTKQ